MKIKDKKEHIQALIAELDVLKSRVEPHDTGHILTAISVLEERVKELLNEL